MFQKIFLTLFLFFTICEGIYLNPYSVGSYDPAAENPYYYQYYGRYYNPNPHNPYAPYPTYLKKGYFTLPRMYQIDPYWARYYPGSLGRNIAPNSPDYFNQYSDSGKDQSLISSKKKKVGDTESIAVFPDGCESSIENLEYETNTQANTLPRSPESTVVRSQQDNVARSSWSTRTRYRGTAVASPRYVAYNSPRSTLVSPQRNTVSVPSGAPLNETQMLLENLETESRPKWSDTAPTIDVLMNFAKPATIVRPRVPRNSGSTQLERQYEVQGNSDGATDYVRPRDFERLPIDRISFNQNKGTNDGSTYVRGPR